jgi:uncharacterized membrane protein
MQPLSVKECVNFGWETFKKRPWILIGGILLALIVSAIPGMFSTPPEIGPDGQVIHQPLTTYDAIVTLVGVLVSMLAGLGMTNFALRAHDNVEAVQISDLWHPHPFWRFLGAYFLSALIIAAGYILLIVPGIIASLGLSFVAFLVVDRGAGVIDSLKESWRITKGHKWQLLLLFLVLGLINLLGIIALLIGVIVTLPITLLAFTHAYRLLAARAG